MAFTALGADSAGGAADLPESGLTWVLDTPAAGRIDASTACSPPPRAMWARSGSGLTYQGQDVGSASVTIAEPDQVYFAGKSLSLDYEKTSDLGLTVKSSLRDIHYHDGDFTWSIRSLTEGVSADGIGTIVDNRLHTAAKAQPDPQGGDHRHLHQGQRPEAHRHRHRGDRQNAHHPPGFRG